MSELVFDGQREDEEVQFTFRRSLVTARKGVLFLIIAVGIGILPMVMWPDDSRMFWVFMGCILVGLMGLGYAYMLWYFSLYIVTDQRIRQVSQKGLFQKTVVDLSLDKIQSVSVNTPSAMAGIFRYGTILIQTGVGDMVISQVSNPEKIHNKLQNVAREVGA